MSKQKQMKLAVLNNIKIKNPCHESWQDMSGDEQKKYCAKCDHCVTNLSALTKKQAKKILENRGTTRMCIRYKLSKEGTIQFKQPYSLKTLWRSVALSIGTIFTLFGISDSSFAQNTVDPQAEKNDPQHYETRMGDMVKQEPSPTIEPHPDDGHEMGIVAPAEGLVEMGEITPAPEGDIK